MQTATLKFSCPDFAQQELRFDFQQLDRLCLDALRHEVMAWPKPGLVTPIDSGSHNDMHIGTFLTSIDALAGSFGLCARAGAQCQPFKELQAIGLKAEQKMLHATQAINTHRGTIFILGLLAAAAGWRSVDEECAGLSCGAVVSKDWGDEITAARAHAPASHGNSVFQRYTVGGARLEAAAGFPAIYSIGLPTLRRLLALGHDPVTARIGTLLALMETLPDTNLLWRGGEDGLDFVRHSAAIFNRNGGVAAPAWQDHLLELHQVFMARNLSPGGSADMMAASWVVHQLDTFPWMA